MMVLYFSAHSLLVFFIKYSFFWMSDSSWLSVDPSTLDQILGEKFGQLGVGGDREAASEILPQLESFLNRTSDYEGLTPASNSNSRKTSTARKRSSHLAPPSSARKVSTLSNASDVSQISNQIGFDPESFGAAMKGILGIAMN